MLPLLVCGAVICMYCMFLGLETKSTSRSLSPQAFQGCLPYIRHPSCCSLGSSPKQAAQAPREGFRNALPRSRRGPGETPSQSKSLVATSGPRHWKKFRALMELDELRCGLLQMLNCQSLQSTCAVQRCLGSPVSNINVFGSHILGGTVLQSFPLKPA